MIVDAEPYLDFDPPLERPGDPIEMAALQFHKENPHVLREMAAVCLKVKRAGYQRWSVKAAFEIVRYNSAITTTGKKYKLNNSHTASYARWLMRDIPELAGFFATREHGAVQ